MFGAFLKSAHLLWLEVSGALFIALAIVFGVQSLQEYRKSASAGVSLSWEFGFAVLLSLLTLVFGVHSFWKARKLR